MKKHPVITTSTLPHSFFSLQVEMLTELRANKQTFGERMSINILLLAASTTFLEQVMAELLVKVCSKAFYPGVQERVYWKIYEGRINAIKNGTFAFYCKEISELTERSFDKFSTHESWEAVKMLFKLRNHLLHGQAINVGEYRDNVDKTRYFEVENLAILQKYLIQKKLLAKNLAAMGPEDIVNNKVISYFLRNSYDFARMAHDKIISEYEQTPIFLFDQSLARLETVLANMKV